MLQRADDIIHADRRITSRQLAVQLAVSNGSAMEIIDALGYSKVCARCQEAIAKFGWTVLPHPSYSPDLVPSDFHLFGPLKYALRGARFEDDKSVILAVRTWLREQERSWYREGIHALALRWRKAVDLDGDYVEK